ncbi:type VII secretion protein EccCa [Gordonia zhaorongruii]|uniref:type VII secretion protein EccCa n=1 Tax=Gordonia zhaorongruii TaxID=2597659 RepID=UPI001F3D8D4F|nr:type VII secretion protein EccCa [Gordonia zhaorongruii]
MPKPAVPGGDLVVAPPPELSRGVPQSLLLRLLPAVMVVAVVGMIAMMVVTGGRSAFANPLFLMFPLMMVMSMVGMVASGGRGGPARAAEVNEDRKDYLRHLEQLRGQADEVAEAQRAEAQWDHPAPSTLASLLGSRRMWERRPADPDFGDVRVGLGAHRLATVLEIPESAPADDVEPVSAVALRRFVQARSAVPDLPTAVALRGFPAISISGPHDDVHALVRSMICRLAVQHGPDHLGIAMVVADPVAPEWDWLKWLPHLGHPRRVDALGPSRMVYRSLAALEDDLAADIAERARFSRTEPSTEVRHLVVILDDGRVTGDEELALGAGLDGVTVLELGCAADSLAARRGLALIVDAGSLSARTEAGVEQFAVPDRYTLAGAEALARSLARYRPAAFGALADLDTPATAQDPGLPALVGVADAGSFDPADEWRGRRGAGRLRVPIGYSASGTPVELDLKESAHGGMGPHGLCVGATGSGKSELLRTLVLGLIATHSPDELNLVLVDFKGGATFLGLDRTNHIAAVITNLEQELSMVDRMADALSGELHRRQELLRAAGNFANVTDYERARAAGADLPPLPALVIVVDEFSELLAQKPDFAELFVAIGRLGRSLHIHLLLASQRLEEGRLRGLDSHLSYRIGLKTFSANESRTVLGVPDAYHLPSEPGAAYLKCDSGTPVRFRTSYVSGQYVAPEESCVTDDRPSTAVTVLQADTVIEVRHDDEIRTPPGESIGPTVLETLVDRIAGHGSSPHPVWLPPLEPVVAMSELPMVTHGLLSATIGVVDRPYDQRRDPLRVDLSAAAGHAAVVGGPQSGKSTALRTLICAFASTHSPAEAAFYCLDFGGGGLGAIGGLPHVGGVATRNRRDAVRRTVAEVSAVLSARESAFAEAGIDSMAAYRRARSEGRFADDEYGDVFLVVDGISVLRNEFEEIEDRVTTLVAQGLSYGVHVVVTASRWGEIRPAVKDLIGTRVELRLGDALDSEMSRRAAASVPADRPGRGITADGLHLLVASPGDAEGTAALVETVRRSHSRAAPAVRTLATDVPAEAFAAMTADLDLAAGQVAIGVGEAELAPFTADFGREPHLLVFGDAESGKTQTLRAVVEGLVASGGSETTKVVLVDFRRTLLGAVTGDHLAGYATSARTAAPMMAQLAEYLGARLPADDVSAEALADRSWWSGPDVYLVIDDYDLVATAAGNPLAPLAELLGHARDIGFRVILARRSGGLGRALFDPFIARMRDLSCDVLLMSGDPDEGYVIGRHRMQRLGIGRGEYVSRSRRAETIQVVAPRVDEPTT